MIIIIFLVGFVLGLIFTLMGEKMPLLLPEVSITEENSWILNLFIAALNALLMVVSYYVYDFSYEFLAGVVVSCLVINIFVSDFKYMIIMDTPLIISGIVIVILKWIFLGFKEMALSVLSGGVLFLFMLFIAFLGKKIFKKEALGGGDIKLSLVIGLILGFRLGLIAIILSSLLALPYALGAIMLNKAREVPFGPFLIASMALVFMFVDKFTNLINFLF